MSSLNYKQIKCLRTDPTEWSKLGKHVDSTPVRLMKTLCLHPHLLDDRFIVEKPRPDAPEAHLIYIDTYSSLLDTLIKKKGFVDNPILEEIDFRSKEAAELPNSFKPSKELMEYSEYLTMAARKTVITEEMLELAKKNAATLYVVSGINPQEHGEEIPEKANMLIDYTTGTGYSHGDSIDYRQAHFFRRVEDMVDNTRVRFDVMDAIDYIRITGEAVSIVNLECVNKIIDFPQEYVEKGLNIKAFIQFMIFQNIGFKDISLKFCVIDGKNVPYTFYVEKKPELYKDVLKAAYGYTRGSFNLPYEFLTGEKFIL